MKSNIEFKLNKPELKLIKKNAKYFDDTFIKTKEKIINCNIETCILDYLLIKCYLSEINVKIYYTDYDNDPIINLFSNNLNILEATFTMKNNSEYSKISLKTEYVNTTFKIKNKNNTLSNVKFVARLSNQDYPIKEDLIYIRNNGLNDFTNSTKERLLNPNSNAIAAHGRIILNK